MSNPDGFWFVCRFLHDGALSKRSRRVQAPSILAWFQWQIDDARTSAAPRNVAAEQLGGTVQGLADLFQATKDKVLHTPRSVLALRKMLREQLPGGREENAIQVDDHSVRVLGNGEEPAAQDQWICFDDSWAQENEEQAASLLSEGTSWISAAKPKATKLSKAPKEASVKPAAPKEKAARPSRAKPHVTVAATKLQAAWVEGMAGRTEANAVPYKPTLRFTLGEVVLHPKFGLGYVSRSELRKCEIVFSDGPRLLVHEVGM